MKATLITRFRNAFSDGSLIEVVVWHVPEPVIPSDHFFKYGLVYIVNGRRVVGFDNERGKGDHRHFGDVETEYRFTTVDQLIDDFLEEVERWKSGH